MHFKLIFFYEYKRRLFKGKYSNKNKNVKHSIGTMYNIMSRIFLLHKKLYTIILFFTPSQVKPLFFLPLRPDRAVGKSHVTFFFKKKKNYRVSLCVVTNLITQAFQISFHRNIKIYRRKCT